MKRILQAVLFVLIAVNANAQRTLFIEFHPKVGGADYVLNTTVNDLNGTAMSISDFNYYISNIHVIYDGGQDLDLSDTVLIVKGDNFGLNLGVHNISNIEQINFGVGVPQPLNHLDISQYPSGHPLSFHTPSMHWGWTSGYKFLLCDGLGDSNTDGTPDAIFQIHDVGDANYKYVNLPITATEYSSHITLVINCNMDEWIFGADPATVGVQHGSTGINATTMNNVNSRPVFTAPADAGIQEISTVGKAYFVNGTSDVTIKWEEVTGVARYTLVDMSGKMIMSATESSINGSTTVSDIAKGQYVFTMYNNDNQVINTIKLMH